MGLGEMSEFNIYCDESCHLLLDQQKSMVLGALWHEKEISRKVSLDVRNIKRVFGLSPSFEIKWTKVSPAKLDFYEHIINYFFDNEDLHFRCLIVKDKKVLDHQRYQHSHDDWYYKMYFHLLKVLISPNSIYHIYIDIKDSLSGIKIRKLHEVLNNNNLDFKGERIQKIQPVISKEIEQVQLTDLLTGVISYNFRGLNSSPSKQRLVELFKQRSGYDLEKSTLIREDKTNIFIWRPS